MKIKRIEHIAIAVNNLDAAAGILRDKFGLEVEYAEDRPQTRLAMLPVGETYIELLQALDPKGRTAEWVTEKGESLYHICFEVEDIDAALAELKAKQTPLLNETPVIGHRQHPVRTGRDAEGRRSRALRYSRHCVEHRSRQMTRIAVFSHK
jgi:methylmalonyl-CoA/ethylmalonyl-CoA epimerase